MLDAVSITHADHKTLNPRMKIRRLFFLFVALCVLSCFHLFLGLKCFNGSFFLVCILKQLSWTAAMHAAEEGHIDCLNMLIDAGADLRVSTLVKSCSVAEFSSVALKYFFVLRFLCPSVSEFK